MKKIPIVAVQPMRDGSVQHALAPVHVQDQRTKAETLARLEQMRAYVDWKLKTTSGKYKLEWLLWKRKLDRLIEQANAGAVCRSHGHRSTRPNASLSNVRIFFFFPNRDAPDRIRADWAGTTSFIVAERKRHKSIGVLPRRSAANYRAYSKRSGEIMFESERYDEVESWLLLANCGAIAMGIAPVYTWKEKHEKLILPLSRTRAAMSLRHCQVALTEGKQNGSGTDYDC